MQAGRTPGVLRLEAGNLAMRANRALCDILDYAPEEIEGGSFSALVAHAQFDAVSRCLAALDHDWPSAQSAEITFISKRGVPLPLRTTLSRMVDADGACYLLYIEPPPPPGVVGRDCVARIFKDICAGVLVTDSAMDIVAVNHAFSRMTGYQEHEVLGQTPRLLQSGRHKAGFYRRMWQSIHRNGCWHGEIWNRRSNGDAYPELLSISAIRDADGRIENYVGVFYDISAEVLQREELDKLAYSDPLTRLPNRHLFIEHLERALMVAKRNAQPLALLFVDLDNFKDINDRHGHAAGDEVLKAVAQRLSGCLRQNDQVARWGGDELVMLLTDGVTSEGVVTVVGKIARALSVPLDIQEVPYQLTASIGISMYPHNGRTSAELIDKADKAMYGVKWSGRNGYSFAD